MWMQLQGSRREFGPRHAVATERGELTFAEVFAAAESLAAALSSSVASAGGPVALALPNGPAFVPSLLALFQLGVPVALVSPRYSAAELQAIAAGAAPQAWVVASAHAGALAQALAPASTVALDGAVVGDPLVVVRPHAASAPAAAVALRPGSSPTALLKFSSGSTGVPKGIALAADNLVAEAQNIIATLGLGPEDRILADVPLFHSYGFDLGVLAMLFSGATLVLQDYFVPRRIAQDLERQRITVFLGVPDMYRRWLDAAPPSAAPIDSLRWLLSCTAPLHPATLTEFHARFRMPICQHYGSSETGAATNHVPEEVLRRPQSVGLAMRGVEVRVVDSAGSPLPPQVAGDVVVSSRAVACGYVMGAPAGRSPFEGDAFWTGDLGHLDADGFLHVHGRVDQMINVGGLKVSPEEVRQVLERHGAVREAAVVGIPAPTTGEGVAAVVALRAPVTEKELIAYCYSQLADYKVPQRIVIRDELPRGPTGKVRVRPEDIV